MRTRSLLAAIAAVLLLAGLLALDPFAGSGASATATSCVETPGEAERELAAATVTKAELEAGKDELKRESAEEIAREAAGGCTEAQREVEELSAPNEAMLARLLTGADEGIDPAAYFADARRQAEQLTAATRATDEDVATAPWTLVGPTNIGGRVMDVVVDPNTPNTIFIAAATGGVWKSSDAGLNFKPAWPDNLTQTIGALAVDSKGTLYAGTGEAGPGGGSSTYGGDGVYKSTDGGVTWQNIGLAETNRIGRIMVDPRNDNRIFVTGTGPLYKTGGGRGLYLSEDAGATWTRVLSGDNATTGAADVAIDPRNSQVVYAAMWDNYRERDRRLYEGLGSGLYKSTDGGKAWARIGTPFFGPRPDLGRIGVAVAPDGTVYANASGASGVYNGFFSSTDGGTTWSTGQPPANPMDSFFVYGWWFGRIYVDPNDSKHVYQAALVLQESKNGGASWSNAPGSCGNICANGHADQHGMAWDPKVPGRVYVGNDGGVFRSDDNGATASGWKRFKSLPISQVSGFDIAQQDPTRVVVGLQDNGSNRNWKSSNDAGGTTYTQYNGGDGQRTSIAPTRKNVVYACSQYGNCVVSSNGGSSNRSMGMATPVTGSPYSTRWNWFTPIEFDPQDDKTIYTGGEILNISTDDGQSFTPISPDLTGGPGRETNPLFRNYGTISTVAPAGKSTKTIYAGTDDGHLWYTHDATDIAAWTEADDPDLPDASITRVDVDPTDPKTAYVTYSGFRQADNAAYIFKTTDGGENWTAIDGDLPDAPINDVIVVGGTLVIASDVGVYIRRTADEGWLRLGADLPAAPAYEVRYAGKTNELFVGTFGRGVYKTDAAVLG